MPIISVYGKYAKGIRKRTGVTADITGVIRQSDILRSSMADQFGNDTIEGFQVANEYLASYGGDPRVALKILDNKNNSLGLVDGIVQAQNDVTLFKASLEDSLDDIASRTKGDPNGMIFATADLYLEAADSFQEVTIPLVLERLSRGQKIPDSVLNFSNELGDRAAEMATAANAFIIPDEKGGLGPEVPEAYGFIIQTNPATGKVSSMRFQAISSLSPVPKGYNKTDSTIGRTKIPIYLPTTQEGNKVIARLGDRTFESTREAAESPEEVSTRILEQKDIGFHIGSFGAGEREIDTDQFIFDTFDIPRNTVLRDGAGNFSYLDKENILHSVEDLESLGRMITSSGGNGEEAISQAFRVTRGYLNGKVAFEKGDPITSSTLERMTKDLGGGGALTAPILGPEEAPVEAGGRSRFQPRGFLQGARERVEVRRSGGPGVGEEFVKAHEESKEKVLGAARGFFERAKSSKFLNP